jgi:putative pyruvate formate lyase activating enzyme
MQPVYLDSYRDKTLQKLTDKIWGMLKSCTICPRRCKVNRLNNEKGYCKSGLKASVCSFMAHQGEEPPVSGSHGSGTIFFSHCNMSCVYCQNYEFSQQGQGREVAPEELAKFMMELQGLGCHNINLVTPTHVLPQILQALLLAIPEGLKIPIVYNTGGYELPEMIALLKPVVDIYLPDMRYVDEKCAIAYSKAPGYAKYNQRSVKEMHRQVGTAVFQDGIITRGLIIRHLVLPHNIAGTETIMEFISEELSKDTYISLMSQYLPYHKASAFKELSRRLTSDEYEAAKEIMEHYGLHNGWVQESYGLERFAGVNIKPRLKE